MRLIEYINLRMNGYAGCPQSGALGECAAIHPYSSLGDPEVRRTHVAQIYIWQPTFNDSSAVAQWFKDAGCSWIWVSHTLYSDHNDDRDGRCGDNEAHRHWTVMFDPPAGGLEDIDESLLQVNAGSASRAAETLHGRADQAAPGPRSPLQHEEIA